MTVGGVAIGAVGVAIFVILLNYVIQPQMSVEVRDLYAVRGERFNVWYHEGSSSRAAYTTLANRLEEALDDSLQHTEDRDLILSLKQVLANLPKRDQQFIYEHFWCGMTQRQIASRHKRSRTLVSRRLHKIYELLREEDIL